MEVSGHIHAPANLPLEKKPLVPFEWADWAKKPVWTFLRRESSLEAAGIRSAKRQESILVTIPTELSRFIDTERRRRKNSGECLS